LLCFAVRVLLIMRAAAPADAVLGASLLDRVSFAITKGGTAWSWHLSVVALVSSSL
jgi:hypothetical protein